MKLRRFSLIMAVASMATASCYGQRLETALDDGNPVINCTGLPPAIYVQVSKGKTEAELKTPKANGTLFKRFAVSKSDNSSASTWANAFTICSNLGTGWRLPVQRELMLMWLLKKPLEKASGFSAFTNGQYWCATEFQGSEALICDFTNGYAAGQPKSLTKRVRCIWEVGPKLKLSTSGPGSVVPGAGATYTVNVSSNSSWAAVSSYPSYVTISPSSGTGNVNNVRITIAANPAAATRPVNVVFSTAADPVSGAKATQTWAGTQAGIAIKINGLWWAPGNLVASGTSSCKVGAPTDAGLYFHFGSLVGWSGGVNGDGTGQGSPALSQRVKPSGYSGSTSWPAGHTTSGDVSTSSNASTGVGDPCRYYLGGAWRLPTDADFVALSNAETTWTTNAGANGRWFGPNPGNAATSTFFPVTGRRDSDDGSLSGVDSYGYYWSSVQYGSSLGYYLYFYNGGVNPQYNCNRRYGCPVRCVSN